MLHFRNGAQFEKHWLASERISEVHGTGVDRRGVGESDAHQQGYTRARSRYILQLLVGGNGERELFGEGLHVEDE